MKTYETSTNYKTLVDELLARVKVGDVDAQRSLAALALLAEGWRYGDPDPHDTPPDGGGENIIDLAAYRLKLAA